MTRTEQDSSKSANAVPGAEHAEWIATANRLAPTLDGVEYYRTLRRALTGAREQVWIIGWDFHSEIDLLRGEEATRAAAEEEWPVRLADLLEALVETREVLQIHILVWEGSPLFAFERQHLPRMKRPWAWHPRIRLVWDRETPRLGSQHEKMVVIDDRMAFVGGMDLTKSRWDDHEHAPNDERRRLPGLIPNYGPPYHDLMLAVDGEAARVLGDRSRERWRAATGETVEPPRVDGDRWPAELEPLLERRAVAFVRTQPVLGEREEKRDVEASWLAQFRAARRLIYVETQYLAHAESTEILAERLREADGPELVLILPYGCPAPLQSLAMDTRRDQLLDRLREADEHGRLFVGWPTLAGGDPEDVHEYAVYVHAKAMVIDDRLLRIGSSNLNNRSMGLDSEIDAFTQVDEDDAEGAKAVAAFRRRSLAHLLHVEPEQLEAAEREHGSVVRAIETLRGGERTLHPFDHRAQQVLHSLQLPIEIADPSRPPDAATAERILKQIDEERRVLERARGAKNALIGALRRWRKPIAAGVLLLALAAAWRLTPLSEFADAEALRSRVESLRDSALGLLGVLIAFTLLATLAFPVTVLVAALGATLDAALAIPIATIGIGVSALAGFGLGRVFADVRPSRPLTRKFGPRLHRIARLFAGRGVLGVAILRNVPIAPFAVVNVGCGTTRLSWRKFLIGTWIGMLPGVVLIAIFGHEFGAWVADPSAGSLLRVLGMAVLVVVAALLTDVFLRRRRARRAEDDDESSGD